MIQDLKCEGLVKVVSAGEVETQSLLGYKIVGVYQEGSYTTIYKDVPDPNGTYPGALMQVNEPTPITETYFVMQKDKDSALASMKKQVDDAKAETKEIKNAFKEKEEEAKDYQERLEGQKRTISRQGVDLQACQEGQEKLRESNNKMERDLGLLRESLGTKQFNEILGVEK